jgi:DNA-binding transcriptional ArsR family regulator
MPAKKKSKRPKTGKVTRLDKRLTQALNHPLRTEIIAILSDTCASPSEMADMLAEDLSKVSYHTKQLLELDCIEIVDKEQIRGAVKTRYRATTKMLLDNPDWEKLGRTVRTGISINALNEVSRRAADALESGTFDCRTDRTLITMKLDVDEQGWVDANDALRTAYERIGEVEIEAATRRLERGGKTFRMTASLLGYESPLQESAEDAPTQ